MIEEITLTGRWYLPDFKDRQLNGTLHFSAKEGARLELSGKFASAEPRVGEQSYDVINGITNEGKLVTLAKCVLFESTIAMGDDLGSYLYLGDFAFVGAAFPSLDDIRLAELQVRYAYLDEWVRAMSIQVTRNTDDNAVTIYYKQPDPIPIGSLENCLISVVFAHTGPWIDTYNVATIKQEAYIRIEFKNMQSWMDIVALTGRVRDFLSLAFWEPTFPVKMMGFYSATAISTGSDETEEGLIDVYFRPSGQPVVQVSLSPHLMFFMLDDVLDDIQVMVSNFVRTEHALKPAFDLYFAMMYSPQTYLEPRFLSLVQAVEVFCRRTMSNEELPQAEHKARLDAILAATPAECKAWLEQRLEFSNEPTLKVRLSRLLTDADLLPIISTFVPNTKQFVRRTVDTRNYYTHYNSDLYRRAAHNVPLYYLTEKLKLLLEIFILANLGLPIEKIEYLTKRRREHLANRAS